MKWIKKHQQGIRLTRRQAIQGAALMAAACGRTDLIDTASVDQSAPEEGEEMIHYEGKPLHLTAKTDLQSNTASGVNAVSLRNPMGLPMEITSIVWHMEASFLDAPAIGNALGGLIACKLDLGKIPITNGFVPVWCFGRSEQLRNETAVPGTVAGPRSITTQTFLWRLPRPLYVPSGAVVAPNFQHRGLLVEPVTVRIGYNARSLPGNAKPPKTLCIPYAASYVSKNFDIASITTFDQDQSTETDLVNPFDESLHLQRFTGRSVIFDNLSPSLSSEVNSIVSTRAMTVRMVDSHGRPVIPNFTPFRTAFAGMTRSWETDGAKMDPRSYYLAQLQLNSLGAPSRPITAQAQIGLVGWREMVGEP